MDEPRKLSALETFLALTVEILLRLGIITAAQIIKKFGSRLIMEGFAERLNRRGEILQACVGLKLATATRRGKDVQVATDDLQTALDVGDTTPDAILEALTINDLIRHQKLPDIWSMVMETMWMEKDTSEHRQAVIEMLDDGLNLLILTYRQMMEAIGLEHLMSDKVPAEKRALLFEMYVSSTKKYTALNEMERTSMARDRLSVKELVGFLAWNLVGRALTWLAHDQHLVQLAGEPPALLPVAASEELFDLLPRTSSAAPPDEVPNPAGVSVDEGDSIELDADEPSGVHPEAAVPVADPDASAAFAEAARKEGSAPAKLPSGDAPSGGYNTRPASPSVISVPATGKSPPPPPSPAKKRVVMAKAALQKAKEALDKAVRENDRLFSADTEIGVQNAEAEVQRAEAVLKMAEVDLGKVDKK